jgi:hypothetical protein
MRTDRRIANAGRWFVSAWLLGLFVAPSAPAPDAADATIAAHFADHPFATGLQSVLIHGIAGVALIVLALTLRAGRGATLAGVAAGLTSLVQAAVGIATSAFLATHAAAATTATALAHADRDRVSRSGSGRRQRVGANAEQAPEVAAGEPARHAREPDHHDDRQVHPQGLSGGQPRSRRTRRRRRPTTRS